MRRDAGRGKCVVPALFRAGVYESVRRRAGRRREARMGAWCISACESSRFSELRARTMRSSNKGGHRIFILLCTLDVGGGFLLCTSTYVFLFFLFLFFLNGVSFIALCGTIQNDLARVLLLLLLETTECLFSLLFF